MALAGPHFERNLGQASPDVRFLARGSRGVVYLTPRQAIFATREAALYMTFVGSAAPRITGLDPLPGRSNYILGRDPRDWRTEVPHYARVRYENLYPGVDLIFYDNERRLEYDFVVHPGADPAAIRLAFSGAQDIHIDEAGDLVLLLPDGEIRQRRPLVYQESASVGGRYVRRGPHEIGFEVGSYDRSKPLVIDPVLQFSTLLGGTGADSASSVAVDASGNVYLAGTTTSVLPSTSGAPAGGRDVFIAKFNSAGSAVGYITYVGGGGDETAAGITVDASGSAYVAGTTASTDFPTTLGAFRRTLTGGTDAFAVKLNPAGTALTYGTYLGGSGDDTAAGVALDGALQAHVTGTTASPDYPVTAGALRTIPAGAADVFVTKLNAVGGGLVYSTYLGGLQGDQGNAIAIDGSGAAYIAGATFSSNFPVAGAFQSACAPSSTPFGPACADAFVAKLDASGSQLIYSTYLGGAAADAARAISVDSSGSAYVAGTTLSVNFPTTPGAFQGSRGGGPSDGFAARFNPAGSALVYSTYLGGGGDDVPNAVTPGPSGTLYIAGSTTSTNFPTVGATQAGCGGPAPGCSDGFVTLLNSAGTGIAFSTYIGGSGLDRALSAASDGLGAVLVAGETASTNFPATEGVFQSQFAGLTDAFVARIAETAASAPVLQSITPASAAPGSPGFTLTVTGVNFVSGAVVLWNGSHRPTTFLSSNQLTASIPGSDLAAAGTVQVAVQNPAGGTSNPLPFTISSAARPLLAAIVPGSAPAGEQGLVLSVVGSGFTQSSFVQWNGSARPTVFVDPGRLNATIPASDLTTTGIVVINVVTPGPGGGISNSLFFNVVNPLPRIASLAPAAVTAGIAGFVLTVNGSGFVSGATVHWNESPRMTTFVSGTQLRASIAAADVLAAGAVRITVVNPPPGGGSSAPATLLVNPAPLISTGGVVNAASFTAQPPAAGTIAAVFGTNLATGTAEAGSTPLPTTLGGVTVRMDGIAVPLFFVSPFQINFLIPWELQRRSQATLVVQSDGIASNAQPVTLGPFSPALFTTNQRGTGQAAALVSGSVSLAAPFGAFPGSRPVRRGEFLELYGVGLGPVSDPPASGSRAGSAPLSTTVVPPAVTIGGAAAQVTFAGLAVGFVGLYQVNVQVPETAPAGEAVPVVLTIGGVAANTVTVAVQ